VSGELDLLRAFRTEDAAVDARSQDTARAALLARIDSAGPAPGRASSARRRRVIVGRLRAEAIALIGAVLVVVGVAAVILSVGAQRPAAPARHPLPKAAGPRVIRNFWPGKPPPLPGQTVCNANLAPPGALPGLGGRRSGVFTANAAVIGGVNESPFSITAGGLAPNPHNSAYAVWLEPAVRTTSGGYVIVKPIRPVLLGVIKPGVARGGRLEAEGVAPANITGDYLLLITLERGAKPTTPGRIVLEGFVFVSF
jgi:hypothetical protein